MALSQTWAVDRRWISSLTPIPLLELLGPVTKSEFHYSSPDQSWNGTWWGGEAVWSSLLHITLSDTKPFRCGKRLVKMASLRQLDVAGSSSDSEWRLSCYFVLSSIFGS